MMLDWIPAHGKKSHGKIGMGRSKGSTLRPMRYRGFSQTWGWDPKLGTRSGRPSRSAASTRTNETSHKARLDLGEVAKAWRRRPDQPQRGCLW
jgi:hypothetical protein